MQGEKIEAWFVFPSSREYFGVESIAFLFANSFSISCKEKKQNPGLYSHQAENILVLNPQLFCLPTNSQKNLPTGKMNC